MIEVAWLYCLIGSVMICEVWGVVYW